MGETQMIFNLGKAKEEEREDISGGKTAGWDNRPEAFFGDSVEYVRKLTGEDDSLASNFSFHDEESPKGIAETPERKFANRAPGAQVIPMSTNQTKSPDQEIAERFGTNIRSALGPGTEIEGKLRFDSPVRIDGTLTGEVSSTSALIVGPEAVVNANLNVGTLVIMGHVVGHVRAADLVEIKATGHLDADIFTAKLVIEEGGYFNGKCSMGK